MDIRDDFTAFGTVVGIPNSLLHIFHNQTIDGIPFHHIIQKRGM